MVTTARKLMTAKELEAMPDDDMRHELVDGRLITMPPSSEDHGGVAAEVMILMAQVPEILRRGRLLIAEAGFKLASDPDTVRAPDLSFLRKERQRPKGQRKGFANVAPDFVLEVLSPDNRPRAMERKVRDYLNAGTELIWVVDSQRETVTIHEPGRQPRVLGGDDEIDGGNVLPGFKARVSDFFPV